MCGIGLNLTEQTEALIANKTYAIFNNFPSLRDTVGLAVVAYSLRLCAHLGFGDEDKEELFNIAKIVRLDLIHSCVAVFSQSKPFAKNSNEQAFDQWFQNTPRASKPDKLDVWPLSVFNSNATALLNSFRGFGDKGITNACQIFVPFSRTACDQTQKVLVYQVCFCLKAVSFLRTRLEGLLGADFDWFRSGDEFKNMLTVTTMCENSGCSCFVAVQDTTLQSELVGVDLHSTEFAHNSSNKFSEKMKVAYNPNEWAQEYSLALQVFEKCQTFLAAFRARHALMLGDNEQAKSNLLSELVKVGNTSLTMDSLVQLFKSETPWIGEPQSFRIPAPSNSETKSNVAPPAKTSASAPNVTSPTVPNVTSPSVPSVPSKYKSRIAQMLHL